MYYDSKPGLATCGIDLGHGPDRAVCARKPVTLAFTDAVGLEVQMTDGWVIRIPSGALQACWQTL